MDTTQMYISKETPEKTIILEFVPEVIQQFIDACAKPGSKASENACFMTLFNGSEHIGGGATWRRVEKPLNFVPRPTHCDVTGSPLTNVMYDAKTKRGPWATMSQRGWEAHGCGRLGTGFGQKYLRNEQGEFYLSEGMSSMPRPYRVAA